MLEQEFVSTCCQSGRPRTAVMSTEILDDPTAGERAVVMPYLDVQLQIHARKQAKALTLLLCLAGVVRMRKAIASFGILNNVCSQGSRVAQFANVSDEIEYLTWAAPEASVAQQGALVSLLATSSNG